MKSNSTLKVPTTAFMSNNAFTTTTSWIWGCILLTALLFSGVSFGQGTTCAGATLLTIDGACDAGTISDNTQSGPTVAASGCGGTFRREGWYTFTVSDGPRDVNITAQSGNRNLFLQLISSTGPCTGLNQISCANATNNNNTQQVETINATLNNGTYYIKVVNASNGSGAASTNNMTLDSICIVTPPTNDDCTGVIELFSDYSCNTVTGTTVGATESLAGCVGEADDDVWYSFEATNTVHTVTATAGTIYDIVLEVFTACGTGSLECMDDNYPFFGDPDEEIITLTGLTIGDIYYIRVYSYEEDANFYDRGTFDICITEPPVNDICAGAIELIPNGNCMSTLGTTVNATESLPAILCNGFTGDANDDVWYSFEAVNTEHTITVTAGTITDIVLQAYSGSCGVLANLECADDNDPSSGDTDEETIDLTGLTIGDIYYVRVYSYYTNSLAAGTFNICVTTECKTWDGSVSTNWYDEDNWTPVGVPDEYDCVIIPDAATTFNRSPIADYSVFTPPTPPIPALARNLTIENNGALEIESDSYIIITDELNNQGTFTIRNNGSLIQYNDVVNTGDVLMERQVSGITNLNYVYWSSAVDGFNVSEIAPSGNPNLMFEWTPTVGTNPGEYGQWSNYTGAMLEGKGYIVRGLQGTIGSTAVFNGVPRNGTITVPITRGSNTGTGGGAGSTAYTAIDDNWNLLGNPYPSAISADAFLTQNAGLLTAETAPIEGTIYLWDSTGLPSGGSGEDPFYGDYVYNYQGANYISYNITGPNPSGFGGSIAAGQGFFVLMDHAAPTPSNVEFNNLMRGTGDLVNNEFMRQSQRASTSIERHRIWLDIINSNNKATSLLIGYIEGATNGMDRLYDGVELNDTGLKFYSFADENKLSISGKALPFDVNETIPLGFEVASNGTFTIAINNLDGLFETTSQAIYLEDMLTNTIHDLKANPYVFTTVSGAHNNRFLLRFTNETLGVDDPELNSGLNIISYTNEIKVTSTNNTINSIEVYDILGRTIASYKDVNVTEFKFSLSNISNGTFIVKATLYNGQQKVKKIVH